MPQSFLHRPAGPPAAAAHKASRRWAPNIPGSLTRSLSRCLGVDACAAMRIALLYGDMEWRAGGAALLHYSASDYARRQGLHRQTVHADIRRLQEIGAITVSYDRCSQAVLELHGLGCLEESLSVASCPETAQADGSGEPELEPSSDRSFHRHHDRHHHRRRPCRPHHHPCRSNHQSPGDAIDQTLSIRPPTLEKGLKTQEKRRGESNSQQPLPSIRAAADQEPSNSPPEPVAPSDQFQGPSPWTDTGVCSAASSGSPSGLASRPQAQSQKATAAPQAEQKPPTSGCDAKPNSLEALLAELLDTFRCAAPAEWPSPGRLTLTPGRRSRLQASLAHAGSREALLQNLRQALTQVPPWFRSTYPVRPDGSRRPSHQFFDLLFRATAADRDGGPEAWHVFAWSEAGSPDQGAAPVGSGSCQAAGPGALNPEGESDQQRAQRLFGWGGSSWLLRDIEALQISLAERRRLTALLESQGQGIAGAGASQFAEPTNSSGPTEPKEPSASCPAPTTPKGRHRPAAERDHGRPGQACAAVLERP